jgi:hypothetical protein
MTNASLIGPARDRAARGDPAVHDHLCGIYDSSADQYGPACQFIRAGLERKQQCLYIAESLAPGELESLLDAQGVDVHQAMLAGSLLIMRGEDVRRTLGGFTPDAMLSFLARSERQALERGFTAFRLTADMTWLRKDDIQTGEMFRYEAELNQFLLGREIVGLCQYAIDAFPSELLIAGVETHPLLVYNTTVCDNFYFIPPEEYLRPRFSDAKLKRMLYNVISRERLMAKMLSQH